jgi:hypothetical protein
MENGTKIKPWFAQKSDEPSATGIPISWEGWAVYTLVPAALVASVIGVFVFVPDGPLRYVLLVVALAVLVGGFGWVRHTRTRRAS